MTGLPCRPRRRSGDLVRTLGASPARLGPVSLRAGPPVAVLLLLAAAVCGCSTADRLGEYKAARTLHLAPDGRLVVTDQGSGGHDGTVMAVDTVSGTQTVLLKDLPSTRNSGQAHADLAGPSGAAMAPDGTVCAVIGDATTRNAGFATLRCTDGLVVDLEAFQARSRLPSNPYDVVSDGGQGWYVSDGAANNVLHVDRAGEVVVVARFPSLAAAGLGGRDGQGVPTGLTLGPDRTLYVALYGGAPFDGPPAAVVSLAPDAATRPTRARPKLLAVMPHPIALALAPDGLAVVDYGGAPGERGKGELRLLPGASDAPAGTSSSEPASPSRLLASGLDGPTGVARLPDGRWAVAESGHTRLREVPRSGDLLTTAWSAPRP
jgi:hypothetical protein